MLDFKYPWSDFGSINLDFILNLCRETLGIHLDIDDHTLSLLNFEGTVISTVQLPNEAIVDLSERAKKDINGKNLTTYAASLTYNSDTNTLTLKSGANATLAEIELNDNSGTEVVANPTALSTADLTKIKIGDVVYSIPVADLTNYYTKSQTDSKLLAKANTADLAAVATTGSYNDLDDTPTIPAAQIQSDWNQSDNTKKDFIKNKPVIPAAQVQADWNEADTTAVDFIKNKPSIPDAQIQADWNEVDTTAVDFIKNKPVIPAAQIQSDWTETDTSSKAYIQNKPTIPAAQVQADWNATSGIAEILNKPTIPNIPSSSGANAGDVLTHTANGDAWSPVPTELPTYTSADAAKVLAVNSAGDNVEWATAGGGGGGVTPPSSSLFDYQSNWYLSSMNTNQIKWNAGGIAQFNYFNALDNYASDWAGGAFDLPSDLAAGAETEYLVILPTPNDYDFTTYKWSTPYAMSNYQTNPTYLRMSGFSASAWAQPTITQKTIINKDDFYSSSSPVNYVIGSILNAEDTQIWNTKKVNYNSNPIIEQTKIIYLSDYSSAVWRVEHIKIKNVGSNTLLSGTNVSRFGSSIKLMPTCAIYTEYTPE